MRAAGRSCSRTRTASTCDSWRRGRTASRRPDARGSRRRPAGGARSLIEADGVNAGFFVVRPQEDQWLLDHLYIVPEHQGRGIGAAVLRRILADADSQRVPVRVGALRGSDSNRFYARHGFVQVDEAEWDIYYVRAHQRFPGYGMRGACR
ncbi:GNAT family N-acetyltransferase [Burkholderia contaminans]|nr:GNAT family N-acetyltransferase [Burkholderia contaminans]MCA8152885.1 GNAT family N-acetyltransferase [Burkholderia contaminans]